MVENMSVVFLFIGFLFLIFLFYGSNLKKKLICVPLGILLSSFFAGTISKSNFQINILIILGLLWILIYSLSSSNILTISIYSVLLTTIYVFILNFENIYLTAFNFYPIMIVGIVLNALFGNNMYEIISNCVVTGFIFEIINLIYFWDNFGFAGVFDFSFLNFVCIYSLAATIICYFIKQIKNLYLRRKYRCTPLKSQF